MFSKTSLSPLRECVWLIAAACAMLLPTAAPAGQILVAAGDRWDQVLERAAPGDQVVLLPGEHRAGTVSAVIGEPGRPITLRSADPANPVTIKAERIGIGFEVARHVVIRDINIVGGSIGGIEIGYVYVDPRFPAYREDAPSEDVTISGVRITEVGPRGQRHSIHIGATRGVRISECDFSGWAGAAINIVASSDVVIEACDFVGVEGFDQRAGIAARAGTDHVQVLDCRFEQGGERVIDLGSASRSNEVSAVAELLGESALGSHELVSATIRGNTIVGGTCQLVIGNVASLEVSNNTFIDPERYFIAMTHDELAPNFSRGNETRLNANLFRWNPEGLTRLVVIVDGGSPDEIAFEENLWWSPTGPDAWGSMGPLPGRIVFEQVIDLDPVLDERHEPTHDLARQFGAVSYVP